MRGKFCLVIIVGLLLFVIALHVAVYVSYKIHFIFWLMLFSSKWHQILVKWFIVPRMKLSLSFVKASWKEWFVFIFTIIIIYSLNNQSGWKILWNGTFLSFKVVMLKKRQLTWEMTSLHTSSHNIIWGDPQQIYFVKTFTFLYRLTWSISQIYVALYFVRSERISSI